MSPSGTYKVRGKESWLIIGSEVRELSLAVSSRDGSIVLKSSASAAFVFVFVFITTTGYRNRSAL